MALEVVTNCLLLLPSPMLKLEVFFFGGETVLKGSRDLCAVGE